MPWIMPPKRRLESPAPLTNAQVASRLTGLAQLLRAKGENPFKVKAYRRAADTIAALSDSVHEMVQHDADLTAFSGIGEGIASAIQEIVRSGTLAKIEALRGEIAPEVVALNEYPRLDPKRVLRIYRALGIDSVAELKARLEAGEIGRKLGAHLEQHVRAALTETHALLLYDADPLARSIEAFLRKKGGAARVELAGECRRRVEVVGKLDFIVATQDFTALVDAVRGYGGGTELLERKPGRARFRLSAGIDLVLHRAPPPRWGVALIEATGSPEHLAELRKRRPGWTRLRHGRAKLETEAAVYRELGLKPIPPELREGRGEVDLAAAGALPVLLGCDDIRGELHCHSTSSDGAHSIEEMAAAARQRGYEYIGITDHSQSLKIAGGVPEAELWKQLRRIDRLNTKLKGIRVLKSAEVDILADGTLDYSDALLRELDYTICSIHSRFGLGKKEQTERILQAMDNPYFSILGHATGRLLLRRPGYELDFERVVTHARERGCFFEINSSPDRLDLRVEHARLAHAAGIKIAVCTDAHSIAEFEFTRCGVDQARRAGLARADILNCLTWPELERALRRNTA